MQQYDDVFARVYDRRWGAFAESISPKLISYLDVDSQSKVKHQKSVLDLCCGTGQLALNLLTAGYFVVGLDQSAAMLKHAREKTSKYIDRKQAAFVQGNAENFSMDRLFNYVVSTFDAINHLSDRAALQRCFSCVRRSLNDGGVFIFDINTRIGLQRWAGMVLQDDEEMTIINRGIFTKEMSQAFNQITGFIRNDFGMYDKFNESFFNTAFVIEDVKETLNQNGFPGSYCADIADLSVEIEEPEMAQRVYFIATAS